MQPDFLHLKGYPPLPPDETLREAAYLIARGVRPLALVGTCSSADAAAARHRLLTLGQPGAIPFTVADSDGDVVGYASHAWVVDLYAWCQGNAPLIQRHRILGLLLGYAPDAIRSFEELGGWANETRETRVAKFDKDSPSACPQCGNGAAFVYHQGACGVPDADPPAHMHRYCTICKYEWGEAPTV